jgi:hypothetical protein
MGKSRKNLPKITGTGAAAARPNAKDERSFKDVQIGIGFYVLYNEIISSAAFCACTVGFKVKDTHGHATSGFCRFEFQLEWTQGCSIKIDKEILSSSGQSSSSSSASTCELYFPENP